MTAPDSHQHRARQRVLSSAMTLRDGCIREKILPLAWKTFDEAREVFVDVLLHEAKEALAKPIDVPKFPYFHPVDIHTNPGTIDTRVYPYDVQRLHEGTVSCIDYRSTIACKRNMNDHLMIQLQQQEASAARIEISAHEAQMTGKVDLECSIRRNEKKAATEHRRAEKLQASKQARKDESADDRAKRLQIARDKRSARRDTQDQQQARSSVKPPHRTVEAPSSHPHGDCGESIMAPDTTPQTFSWDHRRRAPSKNISFYVNPLPFHRHLIGLQCTTPVNTGGLLSAVLQGVPSESLSLIHGPPGTGKTRKLINLVKDHPADRRILLCAPTNVGACRLYDECLLQGLEKECALLVPPERIPIGTSVASNDSSKRIICSTISARIGPVLITENFDAIFMDEAAQCIEALAWCLLRSDVTYVVLAGDPHQLPGHTSASGAHIGHERSMMTRLLELSYPSVYLDVQHRMAPQLLRLVNSLVYEDTLTCGANAPESGTVIWKDLEHGLETKKGTSFFNKEEARYIQRWVEEEVGGGSSAKTSVVIISPYIAQCECIMAHKIGLPVYTVDAFQGQEADTVILSTVRDGNHGLGFCDDIRRITVALTRARTRLVIVTSTSNWPLDHPLKVVLSKECYTPGLHL